MHERVNYEVPNILFAHKKPRDPRVYPYGKFNDMYWKIQTLLSSLIGKFYLESPVVKLVLFAYTEENQNIIYVWI